MKLKSLCTLRETIHKMKRPLTAWEKTFATFMKDNGLVTRIYKQILKKERALSKKMDKGYEQPIHKKL